MSDTRPCFIVRKSFIGVAFLGEQELNKVYYIEFFIMVFWEGEGEDETKREANGVESAPDFNHNIS